MPDEPLRPDLVDALERHVRPGMRVAVADGCGAPREMLDALSRVAPGRDVRLLLGWMPAPCPGLDPDPFADVRVLVGGPGVRTAVETGRAHQVSTRLSAVPSLLAGPLRPDLVLTTLVRRPEGLFLGTEVGYLRGLVDAGVPVVAQVARDRAGADAGPPLDPGLVTVVGETDEPPAEVVTPPPTPTDEAIASHVAALVGAGTRVQIGPGRLAQAVVSALTVPVEIDSGLLPEAVVDLDERGLLQGTPVAAYLIGTRRLYDWADGRPILRPVEATHDIGRLSSADGPPLIAINTALEIDADGQVNVEGIGTAAVGMIGGHPDFAAAGARGAGLSVLAMPARHRDRSTMVPALSRPVTTTAQDVDVVVTERGSLDLRGMDRAERRAGLAALWA